MLTGCAIGDLGESLANIPVALSPVGQQYTPLPNTARLASHYEGEATIRTSGPDPVAEMQEMYAQGYTLLGASSFGGGMALNRYVITQQAKNVGAAVALVNARYAGQVQGIMPVATPTTSTTYTNGSVRGSANAFGSDGSFATGTYGGSFNGTSTTTTTSTQLVPYSVAQYDQAVLFFGPLAHRGIGVLGRNPSPQQQQMIGTGRAMEVISVWRAGPAFAADILPGDFILSIDGKPIFDAGSYDSAQATAAGKTVPVVIWRAGKTLTKNVAVL